MARRLLGGLLLALAAAGCDDSPASAMVARAPAQPSFEEQCERWLEPTQIRVDVPASDVLYDFSRSIAQLNPGPAAKRRFTTLGLTKVQLRTSIKWSHNALVDPTTGRACLRPSISLTLNVGPQRVYVAREFPRGSCAFDEIVRHELRHVYANQAAAEAAGDALQQHLVEFFGQRIFYGDLKTMQAQLEEAIQTTWMPFARAELSKVDALHAAIDTPEEYARLNFVCNGEIPRRMAQKRGW